MSPLVCIRLVFRLGAFSTVDTNISGWLKYFRLFKAVNLQSLLKSNLVLSKFLSMCSVKMPLF